MKKQTPRLVRALVLALLFGLTVFSLAASEHQAPSAWNPLHCGAGSLLLLGAGVHLWSNRAWLRAVLSRPAHELSPALRHNLQTDLGLIVSGGLCLFSGLLGLAYPLRALDGLHTLSGLFMIVLTVIHLGLHARWLARNLRRTPLAAVQEQS